MIWIIMMAVNNAACQLSSSTACRWKRAIVPLGTERFELVERDRAAPIGRYLGSPREIRGDPRYLPIDKRYVLTVTAITVTVIMMDRDDHAS
jgi:hypothetical protein